MAHHCRDRMHGSQEGLSHSLLGQKGHLLWACVLLDSIHKLFSEPEQWAPLCPPASTLVQWTGKTPLCPRRRAYWLLWHLRKWLANGVEALGGRYSLLLIYKSRLDIGWKRSVPTVHVPRKVCSQQYSCTALYLINKQKGERGLWRERAKKSVSGCYSHINTPSSTARLKAEDLSSHDLCSQCENFLRMGSHQTWNWS